MSNPGITNLKAYWRLDEVSGFRYDEVDGVGVLKLTDNNGVGWAHGETRSIFSGGCADFVGSNSESLSHADLFQLRAVADEPMTWGMWIKPHAVTVLSVIFGKWETTAGGREYQCYLNGANSKIVFSVRNAADTTTYYVTADTFGALTNGNWYFLVCYFDPVSNTVGVGVNDVFDTAAGPSDGIRIGTTDFYVGTNEDQTTWHDGLVDELFFYNQRLLTSEERAWLYNYGWGRRYEDISLSPPPTIAINTEVAIPLVHVFNSDLEEIGLIEDYYSLNWAERYNTLGDFELELPIDYEDSFLLDFGNFLYINTSDKLMVVEEKKPEISTDKASLLIRGRSAESILERRILNSLVTYDGSAELLAYILVHDNIRSPTDTNREIALFDTADPAVWPPAMLSSEPISEQFDSENVYEIIELLCKTADLGFKIVVKDLASSDSELYFYTYGGVDRSSGQSENDLVIFSDVYDNVLKSSYVLTSSFYSSEEDKRNVTLVVTEIIPGDPDEAPVTQKNYVWIEGSEPVGLDRFEGRLDTTIDKDIDDDDIDDLTAAQILAIIQTRGAEVIRESPPVGLLEGDFETRGIFIYGVDFFMGDLVQCVMHGQDVKARVVEIVRSYTTEGEKVYMAFNFLV